MFNQPDCAHTNKNVTSLGFLRLKLQLLVFVLVHHKVEFVRIMYGTDL